MTLFFADHDFDLGFTLGLSGNVACIPPTSTTTSQTSTTPPPAPTPSAAISIVFVTDVIQGEVQSSWFIYDTTPGVAVNVCAQPDHDLQQNLDPSKSPNNPGDLSGTFTFTSHGMSNCVYTGTGSGPGQFSCPGLTSPTSCTADDGMVQKCPAQLGSTELIVFTRQVLCKW